jgi:hypothetical protein
MATTDYKTGAKSTHQVPLYDPELGGVSNPNAYGRFTLADIRAALGGVALTAADIRVVLETGPVLPTDLVIIVDATLAPVDLTLLPSADPSAKSIKIQRARTDPGTYAVNILPDGAETIGGEPSLPLLPGETFELVPDGLTDYYQF